MLPLLWLAVQGVIAVIRGRGRAEPDRETDLQLFAEVGDHVQEEATAAGALTHTGG